MNGIDEYLINELIPATAENVISVCQGLPKGMPITRRRNFQRKDTTISMRNIDQKSEEGRFRTIMHN